MKKLSNWLLFAFLCLLTVMGCRESKTTEEKTENKVERVGDEIEDGVKRAGEEVKEEVDGSNDDN